MGISRLLAAAAVAAGMTVGMPPTVQAQPPGAPPEVLEGVYTYHQDGEALITWTIYPTCVPTVGDLREPLYLPVACRLHVERSSGPGGDAVMVGGQWTFSRNEDGALKCPDGTTAAVRDVYSFNGTTLAGNRESLLPAACGNQPSLVNTPFSLAYKEPLPLTVDRYPLICEPGGLRRCF